MSIELGESLGRAALFLGVPFVIGIFLMQWKWARDCDKNINVLYAMRSGGGKFMLAPKTGGEVTIHNPETNEDRIWPINELATIDVPYPGVGFVPQFMQKTIRLAVVNEGDWEPMLNRSPHRKKVASPDVIEYLLAMAEEISEKYPDTKIELLEFVGGLSTGPTREMIADPAMLGSLMMNDVVKKLASMGDDFMETMKRLTGQLSRLAGLNPTVVYIGLGLAIILIVVVVFKEFQASNVSDTAAVIQKLDTIQRSLGIK